MSDEKSTSSEAELLFLQHDGYFRETFEIVRVGKAFLKKALPSETLAELNLDELSIENRHYKDEALKDKIVDVIYRVPLKNRDECVDFFVILEHKSYPDNLVMFQLWCYVFYFCRLIFERAGDKKRRKSNFRFPPVIAIIVHHGRSRFRGIPELAKLFISLPGLEEHLPHLKAILFDLNTMKDDDPRLNDPEEPEFRVVIMTLKVVFRKDILPTLREVLLALKPYSDDPTMRRVIRLTWIYLTSSAKYVEKNYDDLFRTFQEITGENMPTMVENWIAQGRVEGRVEGETERETKAVIRILIRKWDCVPESLKERISAISDLEKLEHLFDLAWDCDSLDEFAKHVP